MNKDGIFGKVLYFDLEFSKKVIFLKIGLKSYLSDW